MDYPYVYRLKRPLYIYSEDGSKSNSDKLRGMLQFAPYRAARTAEPKCLFVYTEHDSQHAQQLYLALKNGIASFPGCKRLTGINLDRQNVELLKIPGAPESHLAQSFFVAIQNRLASDQNRPDFAFILYSKQPRTMEEDPYNTAKTALTQHGIPSQFVSWELLESPNTFRYAMSNIALAFFVKLGGVPWSVSLGQQDPTLVFGIGAAELPDKDSITRRRFIGFAVCVLSNGLYLDTSYFSPATTYEQFLQNLDSGMRAALGKMIGTYKNVSKVTVHVSRLEKYTTIDRMRAVIRDFETQQQLPIPFEMIRLTEDSDFGVFDLSHPGYVGEEGTVVALAKDHALIVTEGRREMAIWRGRKPVTLELQRNYVSSPALQLRDSINDAFRLSSINWRGFNAVTQPVSLQYAKLIAQKIAKMSVIDPDICSSIERHASLATSPWFI